MKERTFEVLCAAILGCGQLFLMAGFDSESFILESVIHSIHERNPETISPYAGYYGQSIIYAFYTLTCLFSPSILTISHPKVSLILSATFATAIPIGFLFTNSYFYYFSTALFGVGFALFFQGQGGYLTSHSTRRTLESNVSLSWSIGLGCMVFGAGILGGITYLSADQTNLTDGSHKMERRFSENEIIVLFSTFTVISILGIVTFALLPSRDVEDCIESSNAKQGTFWKAFKLTCATTMSPKMLQLIPVFSLLGIHISLWLSVFPTAISFTMHNTGSLYLTAIYSLGIGLGELIMGVAVAMLSKRIPNFGQKPTMAIGAVCTMFYCILIHLSTAYDASFRPSHEEPILFYHSNPLIFLIGLLAGFADCCLNSVRAVICALVMPERRAQAFSVSKIYQSLSTCIIFFLSPSIPMYVYTIGLPILTIIACASFFSVAGRTQEMERKMTNEKI